MEHSILRGCSLGDKGMWHFNWLIMTSVTILIHAEQVTKGQWFFLSMILQMLEADEEDDSLFDNDQKETVERPPDPVRMKFFPSHAKKLPIFHLISMIILKRFAVRFKRLFRASKSVSIE